MSVRAFWKRHINKGLVLHITSTTLQSSLSRSESVSSRSHKRQETEHIAVFSWYKAVFRAHTFMFCLGTRKDEITVSTCRYVVEFFLCNIINTHSPSLPRSMVSIRRKRWTPLQRGKSQCNTRTCGNDNCVRSYRFGTSRGLDTV